MQVDARDPSSTRTSTAPGPNGSRSEVAKLRALCRRQASVIDTLTTVVATQRGGARGLRAENAELRARNDRLSLHPRSGEHANAPCEGEMIERRVRLDVHAPQAARVFVAEAAARERVGDLHVVFQQRAGTWCVCDGAASEPLSEHTSETDAEAAAQVLARVTGAERVVIHDRYHRTHLGAARA